VFSFRLSALVFTTGPGFSSRIFNFSAHQSQNRRSHCRLRRLPDSCFGITARRA
jgi:hypothetical protein